MGLIALNEIDGVVRETEPADFAARYPGQDLVLVEPYEKEREYGGGPHPDAEFMALPRDVNRPVPVGRDARAVVQLDHAAVSRLHAMIAWTHGGWKAMDRSSNGCWLDGERLPREQPVPLPYSGLLRLGRAAVLRIYTPEGLHSFVRRSGGPTPAVERRAPPPQPTDPQSETWRFPAIRDEPPPPPPPAELPPGDFAVPAAPPPPTPAVSPGGDFELDFDFADAPGTTTPLPATLRPPPPREPPRPPQPPKPPKPVEGDLEFDFELDGDGRGGFA